MMSSMQTLGLFENGLYMVIHVNIMLDSVDEAENYLWGELLFFV